MNSGGYVFILDRLKDIIIRGGENIDCTEVENMAYTFTPIRKCSVFGLPDARLGEVVGMAVYPNAAGGVNPKEVREFLPKSSLSKFKVPDAINIFMTNAQESCTGAGARAVGRQAGGREAPVLPGREGVPRGRAAHDHPA